MKIQKIGIFLALFCAGIVNVKAISDPVQRRVTLDAKQKGLQGWDCFITIDDRGRIPFGDSGRVTCTKGKDKFVLEDVSAGTHADSYGIRLGTYNYVPDEFKRYLNYYDDDETECTLNGRKMEGTACVNFIQGKR